jgi:hypothetical protein
MGKLSKTWEIMLWEIHYKEGKCIELAKDHPMDGFGISSVELYL